MESAKTTRRLGPVCACAAGATALLTLVATLADAATRQVDVLDRVLAVVDGRPITLSDVRGFLALGLVEVSAQDDPEPTALEALIDRALILREVERFIVPEPDPQAIEARVERVRQRFEGAEGLQAVLRLTGMTAARVQSIVRDDLRIASYLDQRFGASLQLTEDELARYYREHEAEFTEAGRPLPFDQVRARVRQRLETERRESVIADWLERLRQRVPLTRVAPT